MATGTSIFLSRTSVNYLDLSKRFIKRVNELMASSRIEKNSLTSSYPRRGGVGRAKRLSLRFQLLEERRLLAVDGASSLLSIDVENGLCRPAAEIGAMTNDSSGVSGDIVSAVAGAEVPTAPSDPIADAVDTIRPLPEGVGMIPLPPEQSVGNGAEPGGSGGGNGPEFGPSGGISTADTFRMHSRPGASKTIYLDFDGFVANGTTWNDSYGLSVINSPAYDPGGNGPSFTNAELLQIQEIWYRVAEDFAPFDVNVTTEEPPESDLVNTGNGDDRWGMRAVMTIDDWAACGCGGFAYIDSFNWDYNSPGATDTPTYIFNLFPSDVALAISHEVGHSLGLSHDGTTSAHPFQPNAAYYLGHGAFGDENAWGPIMGAPYTTNVVTWDRAEYVGANNGATDANYGSGPDDLAVITSQNGFGYRPDDAGNNQATAVEIEYGATNAFDPTLVDVAKFGVIETPSDVDVIKFSTGQGTIDLQINSYASQVWISDGAGGYVSTEEDSDLSFVGFWGDNNTSNLDVSASIYDSFGALIATSNPTGLSAGFNGLSLAAGTYYLVIDGVGFGSPTDSLSPSGYTDYGSLGQYYVTGTLVDVGGPLAVGTAPDIQFTSTADYLISVEYTDRDGVDVSTLDSSDIRVIGPNGYTDAAALVEIVDQSNLNRVTATYSISAPNGVWDSSANGTYTILLEGNQVADLDGEFGEAGVIGTFDVNVAPTIGPDQFGHIAYPVQYSFQDISTTGNFVLRGADEASLQITPGNGFSFSFYGTEYQSLYISSNGLLTFATPNSDYANTDLASEPLPATIAVLWDDLYALPADGVYWQLLGSGEQQDLIIQWETGYFGGSGHISFQAILSEQDNTICVNYRDLLGGHGQSDNGASATAGIKDVGPQGNEKLLINYDKIVDFGYIGSGRSFFIEKRNRPMTDVVLSNYSVAENLASGAVVGDLSTIDPDSDDSFTYELVAGDGDFDNSNFEIVGNQLRTLNAFDFEQQAAQLIRLRTTDTAGNEFERAVVINVVDLPELVSISVGDGTSQRSRVDQLTVTFENTISAEDGAFKVFHRGTGEEVAVTVSTSSNAQGQMLATLTFDGQYTRGNGALIDGNYLLVIDGSKVLRNGQGLDADQNGSSGDTVNFGAEESDQFFAFYGDTDGNRFINFLDLARFRGSYLQTSGSANYNRNLDFADDGIVNFLDLAQFRGRYLTSLDF